MARLQKLYKDEIVGSLTKQFNYKSAMEVPRLEKITLNMGVGEAVADKIDPAERSRRSSKDFRPKADYYDL